jgi:hypothetical protein
MAKELKKLLELKKEYRELNQQYWTDHSFLSFEWWLMLAGIIVPLIIWCFLVDKRKIKDNLLYGFIFSICTIFLNLIGANYLFWSFDLRIHWSIDPLILPATLTVVPVAYMLVFQYSRTFSKYLLWAIITSVIFAYVGQPLLQDMGTYHLYNNWKHTYSLLIYIAISLFAYWAVKKINSVNANAEH